MCGGYTDIYVGCMADTQISTTDVWRIHRYLRQMYGRYTDIHHRWMADTQIDTHDRCIADIQTDAHDSYMADTADYDVDVDRYLPQTLSGYTL